MTTQRELEDRLSRMEATRPRKTEAEVAELRMLRAMSSADLRRLEGLLARVESGDPSAALTVAEQAWIDQTTKEARKRAGLPDG